MLNGFKTTNPIRLIHRDTLGVVEELLSNPMFAKHMTYDPHVVMQGTEREYSEFFTGTRAFEIQVRIACYVSRLTISYQYHRTVFPQALP